MAINEAILDNYSIPMVAWTYGSTGLSSCRRRLLYGPSGKYGYGVRSPGGEMNLGAR